MTAEESGTSDWFSNEELFRSQLQTGHDYAVLVAERLRRDGLALEVTPMEVRDDIEDRHRFSDEYDLLVGSTRPCRIDVKSRSLYFSGAADYPHPTAFVDTISGWNAKKHKPMAIVLVSQPTKAMVVVSVRDAPHGWTREQRYDNKRKITDWFYMVSTDRLRTFEDLTAWLHAREA